MGREVRMVPEKWEHPKNVAGKFNPLFGQGYGAAGEEWDSEKKDWGAGIFPDYACAESKLTTFEEWSGPRPDKADYMPEFGEEAAWFMMYEDTTEGTPISPAFKTPEELAHWLADNGASSFGSSTASYEAWLNIAKGGYAMSMVVSNGVAQDGVSFSVQNK